MEHDPTYKTTHPRDAVARDVDSFEPDSNEYRAARSRSDCIHGAIGLGIVLLTIVFSVTLIWLKSGNVIAAIMGE